jgi:hypothetical protein
VIGAAPFGIPSRDSFDLETVPVTAAVPDVVISNVGSAVCTQSVAVHDFRV